MERELVRAMRSFKSEMGAETQVYILTVVTRRREKLNVGSICTGYGYEDPTSGPNDSFRGLWLIYKCWGAYRPEAAADEEDGRDGEWPMSLFAGSRYQLSSCSQREGRERSFYPVNIWRPFGLGSLSFTISSQSKAFRLLILWLY